MMTTRNKVIAGICVALSSLVLFLPETKNTGQQETRTGPLIKLVQHQTMACQSRDEFDRISRLSADGDSQAATKALASGIMAGRCTLLREGQRVYFEDVKLFWEKTKVRPEGETESFWTYSRALD